ncbi:FecR family protein [Novosphingobium malaysiense]|uniref:FecR protein domain-containing protein n=1 Tax=Novosphingobium malaysiense TaxID=1348853 RepID=A0A0B1ZQ29_9SPHN|nr:FecR domain-containing protein [Novosphingobium malaysiense]KHK91384.1 hypothetical protein LK12_11040 [Novosphingobium malaysiense]
MTILSFFRAREARREQAIEDEALERALDLSERRDPQTLTEYDAWREADPDHAAAFDHISSVMESSARLGALGRDDWRAEIDAFTDGNRRRRMPYPAMAAAACLLVAVSLGWWIAQRPDAVYATTTGQMRTVALTDGSRLAVGAQSNVEVRFARGTRRAMLKSGEVFFNVAHDAGRPFTVLAGDAEIRVTGTKFDVRRQGDSVRVSVLEGRVEVRRKASLPLIGTESPKVVLTAGLQSSLAPGAETFSPPQSGTVQAGDWRTGRFFYRDTPLSDIVWDLQRYSKTPIALGDTHAGNLKVTTSFRIGETDAFLDNLTTILPLTEHRAADGTIVLETSLNAP